jgi:hypothetical protein
MRFILNGKPNKLSTEDVEKGMKDVPPEPIRNWYVVVNAIKYPPKQVICKLLGIHKIEFTTMAAHNILKRLGFRLDRIQ